jgi:hypothetical protein
MALRHVPQVVLVAALAACAFEVDVGGRGTSPPADAEDAGSRSEADAAPSPPSPPCKRDADCVAPSLCEGGVCIPCKPSEGCLPPLNLVPLVRNGCATCTFVPPSQCSSDSQCQDGTTCRLGSVCNGTCTDLACCSNSCADDSCKGPSPVGCAAPCTDDLGCKQCVTLKCRCEGGAWACTVMCTSSDFAPTCKFL